MTTILASLLVLAVLHSLQPPSLSEATVYYVKPTQPHNATYPSDHTCLPLDKYAVSSERYFISNAVFLFLSGHHELSCSFNVFGIHDLTFKPYTEGGTVIIICDPYIPIAMRFEAVSDFTVSNLTLRSASFAFELSSNILLTKLSFTSDTRVTEPIYGPGISAVISSTRSTMTLVECECLELQHVCILTNSSKVVVKNHFTFIQSNARAFSLYGNSTIVLHGDASFSSNKQCNKQCNGERAILGRGNSTMILNGTVIFTGFCRGGSISLREHTHVIISGNVSFSQNFACRGGAITVDDDGVLVLSGTVTFTDNTAVSGGAIYCSQKGSIHLNGDTMFKHNTAIFTGGAIHVYGSTSTQGIATFIGNTADQGGAISSGGGDVDTYGALNITGRVAFTDNHATLGGAIFLSESKNIHFKGDITFTINTASKGGAICLTGLNNITVQDKVVFTGNSATRYDGGAIASLGYNFYLTLPKPNVTLVTFINNTALQHGGALFLSSENGSFLIYGNVPTGFVFNFTNNRACDGGDAMYGVHFDMFGETSRFLHFSPSLSEDSSVISSDPTSLCFCKQSLDCSLPSPSYTVFPGELFEVYAAVVGEKQGMVTSLVQASIYCTPANTSTELGDLQRVQSSSSRRCTSFKYSILTNYADSFVCDMKFKIGVHSFNGTNISILSCPLGFALNTKSGLCDCVQPLQDTGTVTCNITGRYLQRQGTTWIGVQELTGIVFSTTCPFFYCMKVTTNISITHLNQDIYTVQ